MTEFKEIPIENLVLRFYKTDFVWTCTVTDSMMDALQEIKDEADKNEVEDERNWNEAYGK